MSGDEAGKWRGPGPLRFFCDEQLGKLARWLRIIGQDAVYERSIGDEELLCRARAEGRVVLTRDGKLVPAGDDVVLLYENYPALQLREVVEHFADKIKIEVFTRCAVCNVVVEPVPKEKVKDQVPLFVYTSQENFTRCPSCNRVFWKATHRDRVEVQLRDILGNLYKN